MMETLFLMTRIVTDCKWEVGGHNWFFYINQTPNPIKDISPPHWEWFLGVLLKKGGKKGGLKRKEERKWKKGGRKAENTKEKYIAAHIYFRDPFWSFVVLLGHKCPHRKETFISFFLSFSVAPLYIHVFKTTFFTLLFFTLLYCKNIWKKFFLVCFHWKF